MTLTQTSISSNSAYLNTVSGAGAQLLMDNSSKGRYKKTCLKTTAVSCMYSDTIKFAHCKLYKTLSGSKFPHRVQITRMIQMTEIDQQSHILLEAPSCRSSMHQISSHLFVRKSSKEY